VKTKTETPRPSRGVSGHRGLSEDRAHCSTNKKCPLCGESHDEIVAFLAQQDLRRIGSEDLLDEQEHLQRELVAVKVDGETAPTAFYRHRLQVLDGEIARRRRLEQHGAPRLPNSGRIDPVVIAEIKERIDLVDLVGEDLGGIAHVRGNKTYFHCRLHGTDSDASLVVYEDERRFWCYGCSDGGDCFDWCVKARNMEWIDAVSYLAAKCRIELPKRETRRDRAKWGAVAV
jgi:hypothetical protein